MEKRLTDRQRRFVDEYIIDLNATQAAVRAGYSKKTARQCGAEILSKPYIREYINKRLDEIASTRIAKADEVLEALTRILRREEKESVVVTVKTRKSWYDEKGKKQIMDIEEPKIVDIPPKLNDVNRAAELLGKRWGLYTEKVDMSGSVKLEVHINYGEDTDTSE